MANSALVLQATIAEIRNWRPPRVRGSAAKQTKDSRSHDHLKHADEIGFGCFISVRSHNAEVFAGIISSDNSQALPAF